MFSKVLNNSNVRGYTSIDFSSRYGESDYGIGSASSSFSVLLHSAQLLSDKAVTILCYLSSTVHFTLTELSREPACTSLQLPEKMTTPMDIAAFDQTLSLLNALRQVSMIEK